MPHFLDLPPELHNAIYEECFTSSTRSAAENLLRPDPPSNSLLLSCRQVYSEAKLIYKLAYQQYWKTTNFIISIRSAFPQPPIKLSSLPAHRNLQQIQHLDIWATADCWSQGIMTCRAVVLDPRGAWQLELSTVDHNGLAVVLNYMLVTSSRSKEEVMRTYMYPNEQILRETCDEISVADSVADQILHVLEILEAWMGIVDQR